MYDQPVNIRSVQEACDLFFVSQKYNFNPGIVMSKHFMIECMDATSVGVVYEAGIMHNDLDIIEEATEFYKYDILAWFRSHFKGTSVHVFPPQQNLQALETIENDICVVQARKEILNAVEGESNLQLKIIKALGSIDILFDTLKSLFQLIVKDSRFVIDLNIQWLSPFRSVHDLQKIYTNKWCAMHRAVHNPFEKCFDKCVIRVYESYKHDDLSRYSIVDVRAIWDNLNALID